ncbi:MAG: hypothetical protein ACXABO_04420 [Promethearchaeota archaeon]
MSIEFFERDVVTITISYLLLWMILVLLIVYPILELRKTLKRIKNLEKNID